MIALHSGDAAGAVAHLEQANQLAINFAYVRDKARAALDEMGGDGS